MKQDLLNFVVHRIIWVMQQNLIPTTISSDLNRPDLYINRELSWIEFNRRVFEEAQDSRHPLLERVKFVSIFDTNLDEFIMIRLAGLKDQIAAHVTTVSPDGLTPEQQLRAVRQELAPQVQQLRQLWRDELVPLLAQQHIYILDYEQLDERQHKALHSYFERAIFPVLTPLAVDAGHRFPHISNRSLNLAVVITDTGYDDRFARVKIPPVLPRLVPVPLAEKTPGALAFVWIEQVIAAHLSMLFPGFDVWESYPFRVLRDADIELREDDSSDLLESIEQGLRERRFFSVVDLAVNPSMPPRIRSLLLDKLEITPDDLTVIDGPLGMGDLMELREVDRPDLKDPPFTPRTPREFYKGNDLFAAIRQRDLLVHHPYDTFDSVVEFIRAAAHDSEVLAVRKEADGLQRYVHLGTGNYNSTTARIYEDLGLLTCRPEIGADATELFNLLTGFSRQSTYSKLLVAPLGLRQGMLERIDREIALHRENGNGHLIFKMNALVDPEIIYALYRASQAGVRIDMLVRGMCCLRPGLPGVRETIQVRSIVGRFLEHSRVYYFRNGGDEEILLGSADMMQRNLDGRVETLFPIDDPVFRIAIRDRLLTPALADTVNARELLPDGSYKRIRPKPGEAPFDSQNWFISHPLVDSDTTHQNHTIGALPSGS